VRHPAGETITVTREGAPTGEFDTQENPVLGPPSTFPISDVAIAPTGSDETPGAPGVFVVTGFDLYMPFDAPALVASDRITFRGVDGWQVEGEATVSGWRNPFNGSTPGAVVHVRRAS